MSNPNQLEQIHLDAELTQAQLAEGKLKHQNKGVLNEISYSGIPNEKF